MISPRSFMTLMDESYSHIPFIRSPYHIQRCEIRVRCKNLDRSTYTRGRSIE